MTTVAPNRISVTTNPTFWDLFLASLVLLRYHWPLLICHAVFPMAGLFILLTPFITGNHIGVFEITLALLTISFTPFVTAIAVWSARRRNKPARGPFTYSFDAEGMHTSGDAFNQTIHWAAIPRIRRSRRFLFIFISPSKAHCIPMAAINDPQFLNELCRLAGGCTDFGPNNGPDPKTTGP